MEQQGLGVIGGFVYTMNIVIGAGFLSIPYAFAQSGVVLSLLYLLILSLQNIYLTLMFLEIIHKSKYLKAWQNEGTEYHLTVLELLRSKKHSTIDREFPDISQIPRIDACTSFWLIFGKKFGIFYLIIVTLCFEGSMIAYVSIFASSFTSNIPVGDLSTCDIYESGVFSKCGVNYWVFVVIYGIIVIFLSFKGLEEQKAFQFLMCIMRFVIMTIIIVCCFFLILRGKDIDSSDKLTARPSLARPENSGITIPIIIFALLYQIQMPSVAELVNDKPRNLWRIVALVTVVSFFFYGALGLVVPFAINDLESEVSINFREYSAGYKERTFWMHFVSFVVVLFPAFDVISSFPLSSISLADNWIAVLYGKQQVGKKVERAIKGVIAVVPVFIAFFVFDLGKILDVVGVIPLFTFNVVVPLGYIPVRTLCDVKSPYDLRFYRKWVNLMIAFLNFVLMIYSFVRVVS
jgi:amino acid permease